MNKAIWEGWTADDFIDVLTIPLHVIMSGESWRPPIKTKAELKAWCAENQPHYKKPVPEVVNFFARQYGLK